jgi:hypothetical protein
MKSGNLETVTVTGGGLILYDTHSRLWLWGGGGAFKETRPIFDGDYYFQKQVDFPF